MCLRLIAETDAILLVLHNMYQMFRLARLVLGAENDWQFCVSHVTTQPQLCVDDFLKSEFELQ